MSNKNFTRGFIIAALMLACEDKAPGVTIASPCVEFDFDTVTYDATNGFAETYCTHRIKCVGGERVRSSECAGDKP